MHKCVMIVSDRNGVQRISCVEVRKPGYGGYFFDLIGFRHATVEYARKYNAAPGATFSNDPTDFNTYDYDGLWVSCDLFGYAWDMEDFRESMRFFGYKILEEDWDFVPDESFEVNPKRPLTMRISESSRKKNI